MAKNSNSMPSMGAWAFLGGLVVAVLAGAFGAADSTVALVLGVLGLIVGLMNVSDKEVMMFLLAGIAFLTSANNLGALGVQLLGPNGLWIAAIFANVAVFVAPAVAVVAIKAVYNLSKE